MILEKDDQRIIHAQEIISMRQNLEAGNENTKTIDEIVDLLLKDYLKDLKKPD